MSITYPDNAKRKSRVYQLGTDIQDYLNEATDDYKQLQTTLQHVNEQIAQVYNQAHLEPPPVTKVDVLKEVGVTDKSTLETALDISAILIDVIGLGIQVKFLAPAATKLLVRLGVFTAEKAEQVLWRVSIPLLEDPIEVTLGGVAGQILGAAVGSVAVVGIDLGIGAIEGKIEKGELIDGIHKLYPQRTAVKLCQLKTQELLASATAVKTLLDVFTSAGLPITEQVIYKLIQKDVQPSMDKSNGYTQTSIEKDLRDFDTSRGAYMSDDPA